jgi:hypothetical protein
LSPQSSDACLSRGHHGTVLLATPIVGIQLYFGHQEVEFISCSLITVLADRECAGVAPFFVFAIDRTELYLHSALTCVLPLKVSVPNKSSGMLGYRRKGGSVSVRYTQKLLAGGGFAE